MARKTLKEKLMRAKTRGKAVTILTEWRCSWQRQFKFLVRKMDQAKKEGDLRTLGCCIGELDAMQEKLFKGVQVITQQLIQPDGPLDTKDTTPLWAEEE